jgi:hypothetical protein
VVVIFLAFAAFERRWLLLCLALPLLLAGCGRQPKTLAECRTVSEAACRDAQRAFESRNPKKAASAVKRGRSIQELAAKLLPAQPSDHEKADYAAVCKSCHDARRFASLAEEDRIYQELADGWKIKAYRAGRPLTVAGLFKGLTAAARQMEKKPTAEKANPVIEATAELGFDVVCFLGERTNEKIPAKDWKTIAEKLDAYGKAPPPELNVILAIAWFLAGQGGLSLFEIESVSAESLSVAELRDIFPLMHAVILSVNKMPNRGVGVLEQAVSGEKPGSAAKSLCAAHVLLALYYASEKDMAQADLHAARSLQVWPENPIAEFLAGEKLLANGQREAAADSLEKSAAGSKYEWAARRLARRAREIRDGDASKPLFRDPALIRDLILASMHSCYPSESAANKCMQIADRFCKQLNAEAGSQEAKP